jgi:hypothetical protein
MRGIRELGQGDEVSAVRSAVIEVGEKLDSHCEKFFAMIRGFELKQINNVQFSLNLPFLSAESSLTSESLKNMQEAYEALWRNVMDITEMSFMDFENLFPKLNINFETYYSVAVSLLNLIYQMQLMKLYCYRLLEP